MCTNENVGVHLALGIEHTRLDGDRFAGFAQIICDLPIEEPKSVRSSDTKLCARGEIEKGRLPGLERLRHPCPDENRLSSWFRKPRRSPVVSLAAPLAAAAKPSKGCWEPASCGSTLCVSDSAEPVVD